MENRNPLTRLLTNDPTLTRYSMKALDTFGPSSTSMFIVFSIALAINKHVKELDLSWTAIRENVLVLAGALAINKSVTQLDLDHAQLSNLGLRVMVDKICRSKTLKNLFLSHRRPIYDALMIVPNADYDLHNESTQGYAKCVEIGDDFNDHLQLVAADTSESGTHFGHSLFALKDSSVEILNLGSSELTDLDFAYLSLLIVSSTTLQKLIFDHPTFSSRPIAHIKMLTAALKHSQFIKHVRIDMLNEEGVMLFADMLQHNHTLESLVFKETLVSTQAANHLVQAINNNNTLLKFEANFHFNFKGWDTIRACLVRNRIIKLNLAILNAQLIDDEGKLIEEAFTTLEADVAEFIARDPEFELARQLPVLMRSLKHLLNGKSYHYNLSKLMTADERVKSSFLHVCGQQQMVLGDSLHALAMLDRDFLNTQQRLLLIDVLLRDSSTFDVLDKKSREQIGLVLLREVYTADRDDKLTLRRLLSFNDELKSGAVKSLQSATGADYIVTLAEAKAVLTLLQFNTDNTEFKAYVFVEPTTEADFQQFILELKKEIKRLQAANINIPDIARFLINYNTIRCYEMIALDIDPNVDVSGIRLNADERNVSTRYAELCNDVTKVWGEIREYIFCYIILELVTFIQHAIDTYIAKPDIEENAARSAKKSKRLLPTQSSLNLFTATSQQIDEGRFAKTIDEELQKIDMAPDELNLYRLQLAIDDAVRGIDFYNTLNRTSPFKSHLSIFSILFDNARGVLRADAYKMVLSDPDRDFNDKLIVLYALLKSNDGKKLQECVRNHIGHGAGILEMIADHLKVQDPNLDLERIARDVFQVANNKPHATIDLAVIAGSSYFASP